jgi:hypothetical protein
MGTCALIITRSTGCTSLSPFDFAPLFALRNNATAGKHDMHMRMQIETSPKPSEAPENQIKTHASRPKTAVKPLEITRSRRVPKDISIEREYYCARVDRPRPTNALDRGCDLSLFVGPQPRRAGGRRRWLRTLLLRRVWIEVLLLLLSFVDREQFANLACQWFEQTTRLGQMLAKPLEVNSNFIGHSLERFSLLHSCDVAFNDVPMGSEFGISAGQEFAEQPLQNPVDLCVLDVSRCRNLQNLLPRWLTSLYRER